MRFKLLEYSSVVSGLCSFRINNIIISPNLKPSTIRGVYVDVLGAPREPVGLASTTMHVAIDNNLASLFRLP